MKNPFLILFLFTQIFWAQASFEKANELYRKEKFAEAAAEYESILKTKQHAPELYFNLGNAYYKLNKVGPAVYNFEKALLLNPDDRDVRNNLLFAHKMMIDDVKEIPQAGFNKIISDFTSFFSFNTWAWIAVGSAVFFLMFFSGFYFSATTLYKRLFFIGMLMIALLMILSILSAVFEKNRYLNERPAIVYSGITAIKGEPRTSAPDASVLHEGTKVYVLETLENWKRVSLPDGSDGWIESKDIRELK